MRTDHPGACVRRIVVPLDGSAFAESALPLAAAIAHRRGARLDLVTVHWPFPVSDISLTAAAELERALRAEEQAYLSKWAAQVGKSFDIRVTCTLLDGPLATALVDYTTAEPTELVVLSTHGRGGIARLMLGSTADRLVRTLHAPLLLVRPNAPMAESPPSEPTRLLVPLDGSALAELVIDQVLALFPPATTALQLIHAVVPLELLTIPLGLPLPPVHAEAMTHNLLVAQRYLHGVAVRLRQQGLTVHSEVVTHRSPSVAILEYARKHHSEMIAIATRGLGGLDRLLLGSVADRVIRGADIPVLAWNPPAEASSRVLQEGADASAAKDGRSSGTAP
jgi:nucleotide-binding universal stress UspA family protein